MENSSLDIEELVNAETRIFEALIILNDHRCWAGSTLESYKKDVQHFEEFLMDHNMDPILKNGEKLQFVTAWIKEQVDAKVASKTIDRRIASLSSIYSFYKELDIVKKNSFKASAKSFPSDNSGAYCDAMDMDQLKQVYETIGVLKNQGVDIEIPVKVLT